MRGILPVIMVTGLAACTPAAPDSNPDRGAGVGFGNYSQYQQSQIEREIALRGGSGLAAPTVTAQTLDPDAPAATSTAVASTPAQTATAAAAPAAATSAPGAPIQTVASTPATQSTEAAEIAASARAALGNSGTQPVQASPTNPAPALVNNSGISDEQDFGAVASRQSIESDAERLARQREQYQVIAPTAVPERTASGPNIIEYALSTQHEKGTQVIRRVGFNLASKNRRNCSGFASDDAAQEEFLKLGGPERDRLALDPDGDGYACGWDPAPFRRAINN